jgi:GTP-binding protein
MPSIKNIKFLLGAKDQGAFPATESAIEIAFIGRSNAGKSTLVNKLTGSKGIARVSSQPGKTREINFYSADLEIGPEQSHKITLVDLPGFGYSKMSKSERESLSALTVNYLQERPELKIVFLIHDSKRLKIDAEEKGLRELLAAADRHLVIIASKCDRLNQKEMHANIKAIAEAYGLEVKDLILAGEGLPTEILFERVLGLCF